MNKYEVKQETVAPTMNADGSIPDVLGEVEIPSNAKGVNTTATASAPPIVVVSWLESVNDE